jgi:GAF domain-containing protein
MTSNVQLDPNYKPSDSLFGVTLRSIMAIPMLKDGELVGIVYIEQELRKGPFEKLGINLTALQNLVSIASLHYKLV